VAVTGSLNARVIRSAASIAAPALPGDGTPGGFWERRRKKAMQPTRRTFGTACLGLAGGTLLAGGSRPASAQERYPTRTVAVVAPFAAGGSTDFVARLVAQQLSAKLGQQFVVDNRAGANGTVGSASVARARADGYTLLIAPNSTYAISPHLYANLPYNQEKDLLPISLLALNGMFLCVKPSYSAKDVAEFVALAKAAPNTLSYGSGGTGAANHLAPEMFARAGGIQIQHVPYRGGGPAMQALMTGEIQLSFVDTVTALPFVKSGELRALAVTTPQRSSEASDVPTLAESGFPNFQASTDFALFAPANTPAAIVRTLSAAVTESLRSPEMRQRLTSMAIEPIGGTPEEFPAYFATESAKWREIIRAGNIRVE
jgi:tripartite-type tricarboxylate transporter receptor subunit TctC